MLFALLLIAAAHAALFTAGGTWRTVGFVLAGIDVFSAWFVIMAVRESRKLERTESD
ncbi:MAG TPA: hypothetical protein VKW78_15685 [Terriglobales bacterium]|nr:hypothetical protein [Terriglobales bacterium]